MGVRKVAQAEVRAAAKWLQRRKISHDEISPRQFAQAAKDANVGFREALALLIAEESGGSV